MKTYDGYTIINIEDFECPHYEILGSSRKKVRAYNCISILDIETSWNHDYENPKCWIYQWAWLLNDIIVIGRTKEQIIELMYKLKEGNNGANYRTFIHNLPYEFSYLWRDLFENFTLDGDIMASAPHKPFRCKFDCFEFMCSYKMSNRSLSAWGKYYNVEHKKLDNAIDYNAIHYPTDELTDIDWLYMYHDVICPKECILQLMKQEDMRYDQLLMTSTMYVKNEVTKKYMLEYDNYLNFNKCQLTPEAYKVLRKSFVGGITHANWNYLGKTVRGNIQHADFDSHYPTQMITKLFPSNKVSIYTNKYQQPDIRKFLPNNDYAYWCVIEFKNLRLKDSVKITMPYISVSKCENIDNCKYIRDNGRLVSCDGRVRLYVTSYDIKWILKQYTCDGYRVIESYRSKLAPLPNYLRDTILECYTIKSNLKKQLSKMDETTEEYRELNIEYMKSKNVLNGLYGVTATDPVRDDVEFNNGLWLKKNVHEDRQTINDKLSKYYRTRNRWTRYEWGTWVTSLARDELMTCIELVGYENYLYCDTDSIFFFETDDNVKAIEELNAKWLKDSIENNYGVKVGDKMKYMHKFDFEEPLQAFRSLGAKCYAYENREGYFDCTIAGVPSRRVFIEDGKEVTYTRREELVNIDNLQIGFIFSKSAPTTTMYTNDGCIIVNTTHTLSIAESGADEYYITR